MKKLFIPAILAAGVISSAVAMDAGTIVQNLELQESSDIFYVGEKDIKFSEQSSIEFSNLIGYKTLQDAKNKQGGVVIGLNVKVCINNTNYTNGINMSFINEKYETSSWFVQNEWNFVRKISKSTLNLSDVFEPYCKYSEMSNFINKFEALSSDLKISYLNKIKNEADALIDDCYEYEESVFVIDAIDYLLKLKEFSNADKAILFIAYKIIIRNYWDKMEDERREKKHAAEIQNLKEKLAPKK